MHIPAYRATEIESRQHRFHAATPAERKARRKRFIEAALTVALVAAVAVCGWQLNKASFPSSGGVPPAGASPVLTPETAPVRWQRKDFAPTPVRVAPASTTARRGFRKSPAPGSVSRKGASK